MSLIESFAVVVQKVQATCIMQDDAMQEAQELCRGTMVEIRKTTISDRSSYSNIVIHDYYRKNLAYENNLYMCKTSALFKVPLDVWPFLIAIPDPSERIIIAKDKGYIDYIRSIGLDSFVTVNGQYFNYSSINQSLRFLPEREPRERTLDFECIVRYIGPVDEVGPGYMFGLELLVNAKSSNHLKVIKPPRFEENWLLSNPLTWHAY